MPKYQKFIVFWVINAVLLYLFQMVFPTHYTLGNSILEPYQAAVITSFVWNFVLWNVEPLLKTVDIQLKGAMNMALGYLVVNFALVWLIARYSILSGVGISSVLYVFLLALVANFLQYFAWMQLEKQK
jgi:hypothetical protein